MHELGLEECSESEAFAIWNLDIGDEYLKSLQIFGTSQTFMPVSFNDFNEYGRGLEVKTSGCIVALRKRWAGWSILLE